MVARELRMYERTKIVRVNVNQCKSVSSIYIWIYMELTGVNVQIAQCLHSSCTLIDSNDVYQLYDICIISVLCVCLVRCFHT